MGNLRQIGGIQIFAEIYQGATTTVYKGYQPSLERVVLIKVLRPEFSEDKNLRKRFEEEARLIAKIQHPNVVAIYEDGREGQFSYFAAEFVEGYNLKHLIHEHEKIPSDLAWFIVLETAKGLKAAQDKNILHKDIKPSNILISHEGQVKITDFGLASLRSKEKDDEEEVSGTLAYMSPEDILGKQLDKNSDIFSLGATFYEMLNGIQAFYGEKAGDYFNAILNDDPAITLRKKANIPLELAIICQKMMLKSAAQRYQNCQELIEDLEEFQSNQKFNVGSTNLKSYLRNPNEYSSKIPVAKVADEKVQHKAYYKNYIFISLVLVVIIIVGYFGVFSYENHVESSEQDRSHPQRNNNQELSSSVEEQKSQPVPEEELVLKMPNRYSGNDKKSGKDTQDGGILIETETRNESEFIELETSTKESSEANLTKPGYLQITCTPWAVVYIDADSIGTTPFEESLKLQPGRYEVILKSPEFPEYKSHVEILDNEKTDIEISFWSLVGTLKLEVSPWADVYIDEEYRDTVPPQTRPLVLRPGQHTLTLKHPVIGEWSTLIEMSAGKLLELKFNLRNLLSQ